MLAAGMSLKAQEMTMELYPGWTWISYPSTDTLDLATAFGSFTPAAGDYIKSQAGYAEYYAGYGWYGSLSAFWPCKGYMYKSNRTEPVVVTLNIPLPQLTVTTAEPTDITATTAVVGGTVTVEEGNQIYVRGVCWGTEEMPTKDGSHTSGEAVAGSQSITLNGLTPSTTYYVRAYVATDYGLAYGNQQSFTTEAGGGGSGGGSYNGHDYVDLGLPSGTLWATCNVGADTPEAYGDYFAWGETQPNGYYDWSAYQYSMGDYNTLTKYCNNSSFGYNGFTDNLTTLLPEDDAATANWGNGWRMPTNEEWQELYQNTTHIWTTQNGVNGRLFTAANGLSLFLPAAGSIDYGCNYFAGRCGYYWSSSLDTDFPDYALGLDFNSDYFSMDGSYRYCGRSVRPVRFGSQSTSFIINATANPAEGGEVSGGGTYQMGTVCTLTATPNEGYTFINWTKYGNEVSTEATYSFIVTEDAAYVANFNYNGGGGSGGNHTYVDLGLPSGLLWATCNVGADNPEDYGDYFAWGETTPKELYAWATYQYCNGSSSTLTKY